MSSKQVLTAGLLSLVAVSAQAADVKTISKSGDEGSQVSAYEAGQFVVKCVGAAKGGENDCGALDGSHDCAGLSPKSEDYSMNEWIYTSLQECAEHENGHFMMKGKDGAVSLTKTEFQVKQVVK
ncbi:DUF2282 domain-containing protein [Leucothrix pacifica]|uniref:DUF2282 domain-containing protein n=1 Tax=Leucothrix pacifica TaxID=1247513 RepID=A0A317CHD7_9GAMM|nr:DUF2282 domain-containing protein [Leucothrix pacifica]PWQ97966.1 hypothetical protein DKW60_09070 [Leucothrix pacifica]